MFRGVRGIVGPGDSINRYCHLMILEHITVKLLFTLPLGEGTYAH